MKTTVVALLCLLGSACSTIGPGHVGVMWTAADGTRPERYGEGLYRVAAWNEMYVYDIRTMSHDELLNVIASNGLSIKLDASVRYRLIRQEIVALHTEIGREYYPKIVAPVVRSEARRVIGRYTPEEIYSTKRDLIEREIRTGVKAKLRGKHIDLEAILIKNVELPEAIRIAIDRKLAAEQEVLRMRYVLEVSKAAAEEKRIEAQGIADYHKIIASSLSASVLEYVRTRQITDLARSPNAKTVVIGGHGNNPSMLLGAGGR